MVMTGTRYLLATITCLTWVPLTSPYCTWAGANPYWVGAPHVEQVTLTSVRVSWHGLLKREDCADSLIIKHYRGTNTGDYFMSEPQKVETNSYLVQDLQPSQAYTYQVIAREEKGLLGVDYNRSPKTIFTTNKKNVPIDRNDPLPTTVNTQQDDSQVTDNPREATGVAPIYGYEPKTKVVGLQLELFMGIVIGSLVVSIIVVGIIYNCVRKKEGEKDLELDSSIGFEEDEDEEDDEDGEDEYEDDAQEVVKYDMMISDNKNIDDSPPPFPHVFPTKK
eukprot:GFUD01082340.1.p1 GENE.GFUD01082340.1~~GFUD01082340.1.p1  ORF type:complete len:277 (+),score=83.84 GFUD01082340.1:243-1073(+)